MNISIREKKGFTLIELVLVVLLVSILYMLVLPSLSFPSSKKYTLTIENLKEFLLNNLDYKKQLSVCCIEDKDMGCFLFIDGKLDDKITLSKLFDKVPNIYNYDSSLSKYTFSKVKIENHTYKPFFQLIINKDKKHKNFLVETANEVYLFSSITNEIKKYKTTNEVLDHLYANQNEVRDAF